MPGINNKVDVLEGETPIKGDEARQADQDSGVVASFSAANGGSQDGATPTSDESGAGAVEKPPLEAEVEMGDVVHDRPYAGMGKEDLLRFSDTPFWNRFRLISILLFWALWLALLGAVIGLTIVAPRCGDRPTPSWWQKSVVYQIYVRSFYDATRQDGVGDIRGIIEKLDYIESLKVNAILLSSVYKSNNQLNSDYGYEVENHTVVEDIYGDINDMKQLIDAAHERSIAVLLDFIPNYTSRNHTWFQQSAANRLYSNRYWNYYVWANYLSTAPPVPPNNWRSFYDQSPWTLNDTLGDLSYLHQFLDTQPELNLRSSAVQTELTNILEFWLNMGVDGFKVSSSAYLFESPDLQDETLVPVCGNASNYNCYDHANTRSLPENYDLVRRWRNVLDEYSKKDPDSREKILLTDADVDDDDNLKFYGSYGDIAHLPINYQLARNNYATCTGYCIRSLIEKWMRGVPSKGNGSAADWTTGDQDRPRLASQVGPEMANALNVIKLTLPGTAFVYYGEEIGMTNTIPPPSIIDPAGAGRLAYRSPMQWDNSTHANFTSGDPWLPVSDNSDLINVQNQLDVNESPLGLFKALTTLRAEEDSLQYGALHMITPANNDTEILAYVREHEGFDRLLVVANLSPTRTNKFDLTRDKSATISVPGSAEVVLRTNSTLAKNVGDKIDLRNLELDSGVAFIAKWAYKRP